MESTRNEIENTEIHFHLKFAYKCSNDSRKCEKRVSMLFLYSENTSRRVTNLNRFTLIVQESGKLIVFFNVLNDYSRLRF